MPSNTLKSFKDLVINKSYTSKEDDISRDFFNPILSITKLYYRVSAYYSSRSLISISEGLASMVSNGGEMKMIISFFVDVEDYEAYLQGRKDASHYIRDRLPSTKEEMKRLMEHNSIQAFSSLICSNRLSIKFVISSTGIFHEKYGIMFDFNNDFISFVGSMNETLNGLINNFEKIKVFRSWVEAEMEYIAPDLKEFEKYWTGNAEGCIVQDMPESTENLIKTMYSDFVKGMKISTSVKKSQLILRDYQQQAVSLWEQNNFCGILAMATGTGKTKIGVRCASKFLENSKNGVVVIAVPTNVLLAQWKSELYQYIPGVDVVQISGTDGEKIDDLYTKIKAYNMSNKSNLVILGTYNMISSQKFKKVIIGSLGTANFLIADEVHHIAAEHYSSVMDETYKHRLGLSATPERYFDEVGTEEILKYFNGVVFTLDLEKAIRDHILCEYNYYLHFTNLTQDEYKNYKDMTLKIVKNYALKNEEGKNAAKKLLSIKRSRILKKAVNKEKVLKSILDNMRLENKIKHLLVYFEDNEQIDSVKHVFDSLPISYMKIDAITDGSKRDIILKKFSEGKIDCLISMKILDEGVDVSSIERAIIVASSGNSAQFIQRRGRLLRNSYGKKIAELHDILVTVSDEYNIRSLNPIEKSLMEKELRRGLLFSNAASNALECLKIINKVALKYNLQIID
jgi:superfamily II DNA or RNA helicase